MTTLCYLLRNSGVRVKPISDLFAAIAPGIDGSPCNKNVLLTDFFLMNLLGLHDELSHFES